MKNFRPRMTKGEFESWKMQKGNENTLIIPDIHAPFTKKGFFEFCKDIRRKWDCDKVAFTGDIADHHYASFHQTDPDGYGGSEELALAKKIVKMFYDEFSPAVVAIGNHDLIPSRKAFKEGLSKSWIRSIEEVLNTPLWNFKEQHYLGDILLCHGIGRKAKQRMMQDMVSVIQGHYHSESYIHWQVGGDRKTFAMQLGCGIDRKSYAMAYGRHFMKPHINCGVLINNELPIIEYMDL